MQLGVSVQTTTDDGSAGDQCLIIHPLEVVMEQKTPDIIVACGPMEMLTCVIGLTEKYKVPCQVSIETLMACGMGACLGCAVEARDQPGSSNAFGKLLLVAIVLTGLGYLGLGMGMSGL